MNILIVDDHEIIREGTENRVLKTLPNSKFFFATSLRNVIQILNKFEITLILCDLEFKNSPKTTGFLVAENVVKFEPRVKLVAHTNYNSYRIMNKAMKSGFHSFLYKGASFSEFSNVITNVLKEKGTYESKTMKDLRKNRKQFLSSVFSDSLHGISSLSHKETELVLLSKEITNRKELAKIMNVLPSTIDTYFKRIINKLALRDRKEVAMFSLEFSDEIRKNT